MSRWVVKGLQTGVVSTRYPAGDETSPGISPGLPGTMACGEAQAEALHAVCPTGALRRADSGVVLEAGRCLHCYRCLRGVDRPIAWQEGFEWAARREGASVLPRSFRGSLHIRVLDAGDCGACLNEVKLLNNPFYNMHRLGLFITPTPRQADILLVVGPVTDHLETALLKAYQAMPGPKRVLAVGACAASGGVFASGFVTGRRLGDMLPIDVEVPGCPPPPLAILHGLLTLAGRKSGTPLEGSASSRARQEGGSQ